MGDSFVVFLAIALMIIPGLTMVMAPLGLLGSAERASSNNSISDIQADKSWWRESINFLKDTVYDWKQDTDGISQSQCKPQMYLRLTDWGFLPNPRVVPSCRK